MVRLRVPVRELVRKLLGMGGRGRDGLSQSQLVCLTGRQLGLGEVQLHSSRQSHRVGKRLPDQAGRVDATRPLAHLREESQTPL